MLALKVKYGEPLEQYYYSKLNLLVAEVLAETYSYVSGRRALGENPTLDGILRVRRIGQEALMRRFSPGTVALVDYLCRTAQREPTTECHDCGAAVDSAQHTLEVCPRWAVLRQGLTLVVGGDLPLPSVITAMLGDDESWKAMVSFCETVMSQKEADERMREEAADVASIRGRR
ncbi:unnamed protein product [Euphydryas editha]|uniref:Reverse transcriptase n=1 Tax=Euphydryas editha TaxID=104508 RepID=A0AAU9TQH3_EUPED|nr:unnamed protein product [Euphydryas editha]